MRCKVYFSDKDGSGVFFNERNSIICERTELKGDNFICYDLFSNILGVFNTTISLIKVEAIEKESE